MMPKKGRRSIMVDDVEYHYKVERKSMDSHRYRSVIIQNTITKEIINAHFRQERVTPKEIEDIIVTGRVPWVN